VGIAVVVAPPARAAQEAADPLMQPPPGNPVAPLVRRAAEAPKAGVTPPAPGATPATRFKRSGKRTFLPKLVARIAKTDEQKKNLTELLEGGMQSYEKDAAEAGLANDVGNAAVFFLGVQWSVAVNGGKPASETGRLLAVVQVQRAIDGPELKGATDAQKQEFYEWCVCTATLVSAFAQIAAENDDARLTARLKGSATQAVQNLLGVDPARVTFTPTGMEITPAKDNPN
jgi:hypothetical protein